MKNPRNNDYFPLLEYESRIKRIRSAMKRASIDALILSNEANVVYCTGFLNGYWIATMHDDAQVALIPVDDIEEPVLFVPDHLEQTARTSCISDIRVWSQFSGGGGKSAVATIAGALKDKKLENGCIGLEIGPHDRPGMSLPFLDSLKSALPYATWTDSTQIMKEARKIKSKLEIQKFRKACSITCDAFNTGLDAIKEGGTEKEIGQIIAQEMARLSPDVCVNNPWLIFGHASGRGPCAFDGVPSN